MDIAKPTNKVKLCQLKEKLLKFTSLHREWIYPFLLLAIPISALTIGEFLISGIFEFIKFEYSSVVELLLILPIFITAVILQYPGIAILYFLSWTVFSFFGIGLELPYFPAKAADINVPIWLTFLVNYLIYWSFYRLYLKDKKAFKKQLKIFVGFLILMGLALAYNFLMGARY